MRELISGFEEDLAAVGVILVEQVAAAAVNDGAKAAQQVWAWFCKPSR
jgi:hypothetical protein